MAAPGHRPVGHDLPGQRCRAYRRGAAADPVLAHRADPGRLLVREPRLPGQCRRHGIERPVPAKIRGGVQHRRRCGRSQQPGRRHRAPGLADRLLRLVRPRARQRRQAAVEQQAAADTRHHRGGRRRRAGDPSGPPARRAQADPRPEVGRYQPQAGGAEPGEDDHAVRGVGADHAGLRRRARRLRPGVWRRAGRHRHRRGVYGCRGDRGRRPHAWRPGRDRGGPGRGPDRCRHAGRTRRFRRAAVPAGYLLAARGAGMAVLARPATARLRMKPRAVLTAACTGLAVTLSACTSSSGHVSSAAGPAGRPGTVITVGSFDFPESVLLAQIYGQALAANNFPVRILPNLGPRELVDPALMDGLVQLVPEYAGSALEFFSLGRLSATSDAGAANRALDGSVAGRGLVAARPAPAQDANAIVVTAATAARYGLRSIADLARVTPRLVFGGPPECPERAYCLPGLRRAYGLRFKAFIPLDAGGPLTLQALEAGSIGVALLVTTDPAIPAQHLVALADDRRLQPAENITPLVRTAAIARYGPRLLAVLDRVSARLDTGALRALDARVELAGQDPRLVAGRWLRDRWLIPAAGGAQ